MTERQIHKGFNKWLREREVPFIESRMDRKSTIAKSWPDYSIFWCGRSVLIEVKTEKGKVRPDQEELHKFIRKSGNTVAVARNVDQCIDAVKSILCDKNDSTGNSVACNWPLGKCYKELKRNNHDWPGLKQQIDAIGTVPAKVVKPKKQPELPVPGDPERLYIVQWKNVPWVAERSADGAPDVLVHPATLLDISTLSERKT